MSKLSEKSWPYILHHAVTELSDAVKYGKDCNRWRELRKLVIARQDGRCDISGKKIKVMDIHHLNNVKDHPLEVFDLDNLVGLTPAIHREIHKANGGTRKKITKAFYYKWKKENQHRFKPKESTMRIKSDYIFSSIGIAAILFILALMYLPQASGIDNAVESFFVKLLG